MKYLSPSLLIITCLVAATSCVQSLMGSDDAVHTGIMAVALACLAIYEKMPGKSKTPKE